MRKFTLKKKLTSSILALMLIGIAIPVYVAASANTSHTNRSGALSDICGHYADKTNNTTKVTWYGATDEFGAQGYDQATGKYLGTPDPITSSEEVYNPQLYTAASNMIPIGSYVKVQYQNRSAIVRINDHIGGGQVCIDLSAGVFSQLSNGNLCQGVMQVTGSVYDKKPGEYDKNNHINFHNISMTKDCVPGV